MTKYRSSSLDRRISYYPHPSYFQLVKAYAYNLRRSSSEITEEIIKPFFDKMTDREKDQLLKRYEAREVDGVK
jgi:hypothetical protein